MTDPAPFSKEHRKAERSRQARLSRLPFLYDFSLRGPRQTAVAVVAQAVLVIGIVLVPARLLTGRWLPTGITLVVLAVAFLVTWVCRYLNAKAHGNFNVIGKHASGTERGTVWKVTDLCDATEVKVISGVVDVLDFFKKKHFFIKAGHTYVAKGKARRRR